MSPTVKIAKHRLTHWVGQQVKSKITKSGATGPK